MVLISIGGKENVVTHSDGVGYKVYKNKNWCDIMVNLESCSTFNSHLDIIAYVSLRYKTTLSIVSDESTFV